MINKFKYWWLTLIKGIILILLAFYVFQHPVGSLIGLVLYLGIAIMVAGFATIISSISSSKTDDNWGWNLVGGIVNAIFGFILLANPGVTAVVLPWILGFWMIVGGIMMFGGSFSAKKEGNDSWWMSLIGGILTIIFGWFIMGDLLAGAVAITIWIGLGLLIFGIVEVVVAFKKRKVKVAVKDALS